MTLYAEQLLKQIEELERALVPDPLNGATELHAHENMLDAARKIAAARTSSLVRAPLVYRSKLVPPGFIVAMAGGKVVKVIQADAGPSFNAEER